VQPAAATGNAGVPGHRAVSCRSYRRRRANIKTVAAN